MAEIVARTEVPSQLQTGFMPAEQYVPEHDSALGAATMVWAVYRDSQFVREWKVGEVQFHPTLGWRPNGAQGWAWEVREWAYLPALPEWAAAENARSGYGSD
jgi:hypothetical protein